MENNLEIVWFNDLNYQKADTVTDTKVIAKEFEKSHNSVMRDVRVLIEKVESIENIELKSLYKFVPSDYISDNGGTVYGI